MLMASQLAVGWEAELVVFVDKSSGPSISSVILSLGDDESVGEEMCKVDGGESTCMSLVVGERRAGCAGGEVNGTEADGTECGEVRLIG